MHLRKATYITLLIVLALLLLPYFGLNIFGLIGARESDEAEQSIAPRRAIPREARRPVHDDYEKSNRAGSNTEHRNVRDHFSDLDDLLKK